MDKHLTSHGVRGNDGHMTTTTKTRSPRKSPEDRAAELAAAHEMIVNEVAKITNDVEWRRWLDAMTRFHTYSFNNVILAWVQCLQRGMDAPTRLAGFNTWKDLGRNVIKGQKALKVYAPLAVKIQPGEPGYVEGENRKRIAGFRLVPTFDVQQTEGQPLPAPPTGTDVTGQAPEGLYDALSKIGADNGYAVRFTSTGRADGYTDPHKREIGIDDEHNVPDAMARACAILIHEIAHMILHVDGDADVALRGYREHRGVAETEAESVAYVVGTYFGLDMADSSFHYVAGWAQDPDTVMRVGKNVQTTSKKIIEAVEKIMN